MAPITALAGVFFMVMHLVLTVSVILHRRALKVPFGEDDEALRRRVRTHANFVENVPLTLLLLFIAELQDASGWVLILLCACLLLGRLLHAYSLLVVEPTQKRYHCRVAGMMLTFTAQAGAALTLLLLSI